MCDQEKFSLSSPQENIKIPGVFLLLDYEIQQFPMHIYGTTVVQYNLDTILVVGGAMEYAGNPSSAIYSFSRSTQSEFVYLGETIQSRFAHFVYCRGDVSLMGPDEEATLFDGDARD